MSTKTEIIVNDDLDGKKGASRVTFSYEGVNYEIDLGVLNKTNLEASLAKYVAAARVVTNAPAKVSKPGKATGTPSEATAIREWARQNGYTVGDRGRIHADIKAAFEAAQVASVAPVEDTAKVDEAAAV